jgi:hypothetical protein
VFFRYGEISEGALSQDKADKADVIAAGLGDAELSEIQNRFVKLKVPGMDAPLDADVSLAGLTVYLGGFDWVTYPTPQGILQHFPEFLSLPQQVYRPIDDEF